MTAPTTYDVLPYEDYTFPRSHPEHLHVVARLLGHAAPPFATARVLELGCARGANLLAMAVDLPGASFVGVDLSERQIAEGSAVATRVGLANVRLLARSLTALDDLAPNSFDYVVCHGVYSWVPVAVRDAIFAVCARVLAPQGVAYVSFNTLPGWSVGRTVRDYLALHVPGDAEPKRRVAAARDLLKTLVTGLSATVSDPGATALRAEAETLATVHDAYLFHEYLEEVNDPVYFHDFAMAARGHGLEHLCDADLTTVAREGLAEDPGRPDRVLLEQTLDFMRNRRFRASLLARATECAPRSPALADVAAFHLSSRATVTERVVEPALRQIRPLTFARDGRRVTLHDPVAKCALLTLVESGRRPVAFRTLCERAAARAGVTDARAVATSLSREIDLPGLVFEGLVELHAGPARYADIAGPRPVACPLARDQAARGAAISTRRVTQVDLAPFERGVLPLLDGTRDRAALVRDLGQLAVEGALGPVDLRPGALARSVDEALDALARDALLLA